MKKIMTVRGQGAEDITGLLKGVATNEGELPLHPIHKRTLEAVCEHLFHSEVDVDALGHSLADAETKVADLELRQEVLNIAGVLPFLELETMGRKLEAFSRLAQNFGFDRRFSKELIQLCHKKAGQLEIDSLRAGALEVGAPAWKFALKIASGFFHLDGDQETLDRYTRYQSLDADTFGKILTDYYRDNHFPLPGTRGAPFSNAFKIHDIHHILSGYPTTPLGELCVLAFDGALMNEDLGKLLIVSVAQWQVGFKISTDPVWKNQFDPDVVFRAFERGGNCCVDYLQPDFHFTELLEEKLEDVRKRFNISPDGALVRSSEDLWCGDLGVVGSRGGKDKVEENRSFLYKFFADKNVE